MKTIAPLIFLLSLLAVETIHAQSIDLNELEAKMEPLIPGQVGDSTPGLVLGIVHKGELVFGKGYGMANLSYGIPNDTKMVYNIGSVSKQFLGYAFAMLHVEGKLNLDDPVGKYLEDWPEFEHKVTLRHLLTHTSGYREAYTMSNLAGRSVGVDRLTREECLDVVRRQPALEFTPGSRHTYNSTAWVILAEVFEQVVDQSADKWVEANILKPLEMNDTQIESFVGEMIQNAAESYSYRGLQGFENHESNRAIFGAAEVYSSIEDLTKWIKNYRDATIGGEAVKKVFLESFILNNGEDSHYALGIGVNTFRGLERYRHTGGHEAFSSQLSYFPEHDLGIVTISNYGGAGWLPTADIAELLLKEYMTEPEPPAAYALTTSEMSKFAGQYVSTNLNSVVNVELSDGVLTAWGEVLIPTSANTMGIKGWDGEMRFTKTADGGMDLTIEDGNTSKYTRADSWSPDENGLKEFEGNYWSEELEAIYHLSVEDLKLTVNHRWVGEVKLTPVAPDFFSSNGGFYVKFHRTSAGAISNFSVYTGRTLNVIFDRQN